MSRYLLDTNIISDVTKPVPSEALVAWMAKQEDEDLFISSLTVAEIRGGAREACRKEASATGTPVRGPVLSAKRRCRRWGKFAAEHTPVE